MGSTGPSADQSGQGLGANTLTIIALTFGTGATDAFSFMTLGHVFSSVVTGNLVLLGISAGREYGLLALHAGIALAGYSLGALAGTRARSEKGATLSFLAEWVILLGVLAGWDAASAPLHQLRPVLLALLGLAAIAMGLQSSTVAGLPGPKTPTTFMTGTLTRLVSSVAVGLPIKAQWLSASSLFALFAGAAAGAALVVNAPYAAPALAAGCVGAVVVMRLLFDPP